MLPCQESLATLKLTLTTAALLDAPQRGGELQQLIRQHKWPPTHLDGINVPPQREFWRKFSLPTV